MINYLNKENRLSLEEFYSRGPSLWRWIKFGHGKSTPYVSPFSKESLTAAPAPHIQDRIDLLIKRPMNLPSILKNRGVLFFNRAKSFPIGPNGMTRNYMGDGYVFFMDMYFTEGSGLPQIVAPIVSNFYNYLYSYRCLLTPPLFVCLSRIRELRLVKTRSLAKERP